nr:uncharacterized protein LOC112492113 [Ziziphus jujuba var. spinosa]
MKSGWAAKVDMDILTADKDFFQLLINSEKWLNHNHMEVLPYLFRVRANQFPDIFYPSFEVIDGGFWVYIEQCHGKFLDNPSKFQFSYTMQEYVLGIRMKEFKPWKYVNHLLIPLNKRNIHWMVGHVDLKERRMTI